MTKRIESSINICPEILYLLNIVWIDWLQKAKLSQTNTYFKKIVFREMSASSNGRPFQLKAHTEKT